ncbi:MAG: metallophosphoesterase family protein, partial [Eubacterium sp.]
RKNENINICHIADCHGRRKSSSESGKYFNEDLDLLILNGDISHTCSMENQILLNYKIASDITGGHIPVIISRGNHDLRGKKAEKLEYMFPTSNGKSYYTVTIGNMWFLLLDCGEDKVDTHREYHSTVAFHPFREEQTLFLNDVIKKGKYNDDNIKYRFVISHIPFPIRNTESFKNDEKPFDIENEIYNEWCNIINEHIKPQLFISGHLHEIEVVDKADERNTRKICCDILIGSTPAGTDDFISANLTINSNNCSVVFNNKRRSIVKENSIEW